MTNLSTIEIDETIDVQTATRAGEYEPTAKQYAFQTSPAIIRFALGGMRSGKTLAAIDETYREHARYEDVPGEILITRKTGPELTRFTIPDFEKYIPPAIMRYPGGWAGKSWRSTDRRLLLRGMKSLLFQSLDDVRKVGGGEFLACMIDQIEECDVDDLEYLLTRLSNPGTPGRLWATGNTLSAGWVYEWAEKHPHDCMIFEFSMYDNAEHLSPDYIAKMERMFRGRVRDAYLLGKRATIGGNVWPEWDTNYHSRESINILDATVYRSWDPGQLHPAVSFHQKDLHNDIWLVVGEIEAEDVGTRRFAEDVLDYSRIRFPDLRFRDVGDPDLMRRSPSSDTSSRDILASMGILVSMKKTGKKGRVELVRERLLPHADGSPALLVDRTHCPRLIRTFENWPVDTNTGLPKRDGNYEHLGDTLTYFADHHIQPRRRIWKELDEVLPTREKLLKSRREWYDRLAGREKKPMRIKLERYSYSGIGQGVNRR